VRRARFGYDPRFKKTRNWGETGLNMSGSGKLQLTLFGGFAVSDSDGKTIMVVGKKNQALLAYLAANAGRVQSREKLAELLWGDRFNDQARQSLRQAVSTIRKELGDSGENVLRSDGDAISLESSAVSIDAIAFEELAREGSPESLERAANLYHGSFLEGLNVRENAFQAWSTAQNARYAEIAADVLSRLCSQQKEVGESVKAIATVQALLELDPTREQAHRDLMSLYATDGQRSKALKQYQVCKDALRTELDVEPEALTNQLYEQIRSSEAILPATPQDTKRQRLNSQDTPPVPEGASIAVLPFVNLSGDPEQEYFSDGITDDLITALSHVRTFLVIARQSSFAYKGRTVNVKDIGRELGVRYVLEGSVRKAGDKIRVTAQLVEAVTDAHIWAERYDGTLDDIFDLQDKIAQSVVGAIEPELQRAEFERIKQKRPESFDAYDLTLYGLAKMNRLTAKDNEEALQYFVSAIEIDPAYARAYVCASYCYRRQVQLEGMMLPEKTITEAIRLAREGLRLAPTDPYVLWQTAMTIALVGKDFDEALMLVKRSLKINNSSNRAWIASGMIHCYVGEPETAIEHAEKAMRLSPLDISMWVACWVMATGNLQLGNYQEAADWANKSIRRHPDYLSSKYILAASLAQLDRNSELKATVSEIMAVDPAISVDRFVKIHPVARYRNLDGFLEGLKKAGLPPEA
jgi:TolB-like protein/Tfp pilus assembly protein PilF